MIKKKKQASAQLYVDGFVLVVPKDKLPSYKKMATIGGEVWKKHGALDYKECIGDDLSPDMQGMKFMAFPRLVNLKKNELVVFSYITYKSKKHRDEVNARVMKDPMMSEDKWKDKPMPFDMKRMSYGGFKTIVNL